EAKARFHALAEKYGLFVTGSSDYHGEGKPNRLGENTTAPEVLERIIEQGTGSPPVYG
ncbi:MAG TPA: phosphatase, partial [Cryobacterium sp.]|nr:phosphatase [Cryobacterium sp.]